MHFCMFHFCTRVHGYSVPFTYVYTCTIVHAVLCSNKMEGYRNKNGRYYVPYPYKEYVCVEEIDVVVKNWRHFGELDIGVRFLDPLTRF